MKRAVLPSGQAKGRAKNSHADAASTAAHSAATAASCRIPKGLTCSASSTSGTVKYLHPAQGRTH